MLHWHQTANVDKHCTNQNRPKLTSRGTYWPEVPEQRVKLHFQLVQFQRILNLIMSREK